MQWSSREGAGFTTGTPWLDINKNYYKINVEEQKSRASSIWRFYRNMILLRASNETLKYGDFAPAYSDKQVIAYTRTIQGEEQYATILNFSNEPASTPFEGSLIGQVIVTTVGRDTYDGNLDPWEAVVLKVW